MKFHLLTSIFLFFNFQTVGQVPSDSIKTKRSFSINPWDDINGVRLGAGYFNDFEAEASFLISSYPKRDPGLAGLAMRVQYIGAGLEYLRIDKKNVLGAKLSYENTISILAFQIGTDFLVSDQDIQYRILPRAGLSLFGTWTIYYGYNFNMVSNSKLLPSTHLISLQCNILHGQNVAIWQ